MPTIIDRLLGRTPTAEKASTGGTGAGVLAFYNDLPLWSAQRNPRKLMRQAQELYHTHDIVREVEHRISSTAAGVKWHLEDEDDEEITDESAPELVAIKELFEHPQALIPAKIKRQTRRSLWQICLRHGGLCGNGFWYPDEPDGLMGIPRSFLYINPARMLAKYDAAGNTVGWALDADESGDGGTPIAVDEVLQYEYDPPDVGAYGIGIVESAGGKAYLNTLATRQQSQVLASGGRLTGIVGPKDGTTTTSDDQWAQFVRDWRNITEDPNSAKRLQIVKQPIDYIRTAATPAELQVVEIAKMSREDIFAAWGLPLSQQGITQASGLNSGETKGYDEAILWQGPVHARLDPFREMLQDFLDGIARRGGPKVEFVLEEPEFDDETPLYERAQKAVDQPLTDNDRRAILGLDPLPDYGADGKPLGLAMYRPSTLTLVGQGPEEDGGFGSAPPPEPEPVPPPSPFGMIQPPEMPPVPAKASLGLRKTLDAKWEPAIRSAVEGFLAEQRRAIAGRIRAKGAHLAAKPSDVSAWWNQKTADAALAAVLVPHSLTIAEQVRAAAKRRLGKADVFSTQVEDLVRRKVGERITRINETTRDDIARIIAQGFDDGLAPGEVAQLIEDATAFNPARAELIARTESALAYNEAALASFGEFGISEVQAIDGDQDPECAERDGVVFSLADAMAIEDHPNGTLDWVPIKAAAPDPMVEAIKALTESQFYLGGLSQRPINVSSPDVHVAPAVVNYSPPDIRVDAPVHVDAPVINVTTRGTTIKRDDDGRIVGLE